MKKLSILAFCIAFAVPAYTKAGVADVSDADIDSAIESLIQSSSRTSTSTPASTSTSTSILADYIKPTPDISFSFSAYNDYLVLTTNWKKTAKFPKPAQSGTLDKMVYQYSQDGISINSTKSYIEIKAESFDKIVEHMGSFSPTVPLLDRSGWVYPNIRVDPYSYGLDFNLKDMAFYTNPGFMGLVKAGESLSSFDVNTATVVGYRVGDGELKPVIHNLTAYDYSELKDADHFMIYAKAGKGDIKLSAAAIEVNKSKGVLRVYRTYPFPSK